MRAGWPVYTMDHEVRPWKIVFSMLRLDGPTSMVCFLKHQFTKPLGPSLSVNSVWIKKNDQTPKSECVNFLNMPEKGGFEKIKFDHSLAFCWLYLSSLLVRHVEDVAYTSSYNNFLQK